ncbi:hypothetical protein TH63_09640 [Rufibacter radiotolerans]|uniref:Uncharacterized protein n=1 Tax=Rufibacter radiotolerans TaxID=1379910 RepID=A0A0H4W5Y4_9BACT|nr:hypothetical protein [Rufibacter radiotolerans]AKQ45846.1 hypothetical protein TH63_09640 [Rufibacter radiotolerans]
MEEQIDITSEGPITLLGDKYDSVLYLNGIPIQFTWIREIGSTWRYQIAKSIDEADIIEDRSFANFVKFGYLTDEPLSKQFHYIISKLNKGKYSLKIDYLSSELELVELNEDSSNYVYFDTYAGIEDIIATQAVFEKEVANEYETIIKKGAEPILVVLTSLGSVNKFIMDGHHKFLAYSKLDKPIRTLLITKLDKETVTREIGLKVIKYSGSKNQEYRTRFLQKFK